MIPWSRRGCRWSVAPTITGPTASAWRTESRARRISRRWPPGPAWRCVSWRRRESWADPRARGANRAVILPVIRPWHPQAGPDGWAGSRPAPGICWDAGRRPRRAEGGEGRRHFSFISIHQENVMNRMFRKTFLAIALSAAFHLAAAEDSAWVSILPQKGLKD